MRSPVKFTLPLVTLALIQLLTACGRHEESPDAKIQKQLPGIWVFDSKHASGNDFRSTTTIASDGSYLCRLEMPARTNGQQIVNVEGTFRVEKGFLIDTITKYSDTNVNTTAPPISRARIIRIDDRELLLEYEKESGTVSPTNPVVLRRQTK